jgi:hypothetical protein
MEQQELHQFSCVLQIGLPHLANKYTNYPVKFKFQVSNKYFKSVSYFEVLLL